MAQVSISTDGAPPDSSAMLDVRSTTRGVLVPRVDSTQRLMIANPANGLLVYDTDTGTFWFRQDTSWVELVSTTTGLRDQDRDTHVTVEESPDEDTIRLAANGKEIMKTGGKILELGTTGGSVLIGRGAGMNVSELLSNVIHIGMEAGRNSTGSANTFVGLRAGADNTDGRNNTFIGAVAGENNAPTSSTFAQNTFVGAFAGRHSDTTRNSTFFGVGTGEFASTGLSAFYGAFSGRKSVGPRNVYLGYGSGGTFTADSVSTGDRNTFVGTFAGTYLESGRKNVLIGDGTGFAMTSGSQNTIVGEDAGGDLGGGNNNTIYGQAAAFFLQNADHNVVVGDSAMYLSLAGAENTIVGHHAGYNSTGSHNVFLGKYAGFNETGDHKLYIANDSSDMPLILGDFTERTLTTHGQLLVNVDTNAVLHKSAVTIVGPDDAITGPILTLQGSADSDQFESGRIRFREGTTPLNIRGGYIHYDGFANRLHLGVNNTNNGDVSADQNAITIRRETAFVGVNTYDPQAPMHVTGDMLVTDTVDLANPADPPVSGIGSRLMWYGDKAAVRAGTIDAPVFSTFWDRDSVGFYSIAAGRDVLASGDFSAALGSLARATADGAMSFGNNTRATGVSAVAMGLSTEATGGASTALGWLTEATGFYSLAGGQSSHASGIFSVALGNHVSAGGQAALSIGQNTEAIGNFSLALQSNTEASGTGSAAFGFTTQSKGTLSTAMGNRNIANGYAGLVIGMFNDSIILAQSTPTPETPLFIVGNGDSTSARSNAMVVRKDGKVGIGTSSPTQTLEVNGEILATGSFVQVRDGDQGMLMIPNAAAGYVQLDVAGSGHSDDHIILGETGGGNLNKVGIGTTTPGSAIGNALLEVNGGHIAVANNFGIFSNHNSGTGIGAGFDTSPDDQLVLYAGGQPHVTVTDTGSVGIGTTTPSAILEVNADIVKKVNGGSWTASSDRRLKQDIANYREGLEEILRIRPVKFRYNAMSGYDISKEHIGVIAQELREVAPHMVSTFSHRGDSYLQVDNSAMTYMLINAVKELAGAKKQMKDRIAQLEQTVLQMQVLLEKQLAGR
ncbi:MAG: tail fiber domain-containing protein [Saprospiraceae bacterium]|nr:tail fiber domain-containing protein [Saprospiraceae bacterium]